MYWWDSCFDELCIDAEVFRSQLSDFQFYLSIEGLIFFVRGKKSWFSGQSWSFFSQITNSAFDETSAPLRGPGETLGPFAAPSRRSKKFAIPYKWSRKITGPAWWLRKFRVPLMQWSKSFNCPAQGSGSSGVQKFCVFKYFFPPPNQCSKSLC